VGTPSWQRLDPQFSMRAARVHGSANLARLRPARRSPAPHPPRPLAVMVSRDDTAAGLPSLPKACRVAIRGRGLHSSTFQLNYLSALYGIGGARRGCVARVQGVLGGVEGVYGVFL
jgi:hypothetical protein